jgi:hypothetical protein
MLVLSSARRKSGLPDLRILKWLISGKPEIAARQPNLWSPGYKPPPRK